MVMNLGLVGNFVYDVVGGFDVVVNLVVVVLVELVVDVLYV